MSRIMACVAAIALVAGAAAAEPGGGKGRDGKDGGNGGGGHAEARPAKASSPHGGGGEGPPRTHADRAGKPERDETRRAQRQADHPRSGGSDRAEGRAGRPGIDQAPPSRSESKPALGREERGRANKTERVAGPDHGNARDTRQGGNPGSDRFAWGDRFERDDRVGRGLVAGCPPGLAMKGNGCMPPGQLKQRSGWQTALGVPGWWGLTGLTGNEFAYVDGYLVRLGDDRIDGWLPLLGGALAPGNPWPTTYSPVEVPDYYEDYYSLGPSYGYYDDVLYRLDPETSAISSIAALLSGDRFAVGEPMPPGYDVYNVPFDHRDEYADSPDALYRYSDGYVYQVDPETRLVAAAIELLT